MPWVQKPFWSQVHFGPSCWEWMGAIFKNTGYGQRRHNGQATTAHRVSWKLENGPIANGLFVLHHCDNRKCVKPDHLFLGTQQDNVDDMFSKGRQPKIPGLGSYERNKTHCPRGHEYNQENTVIFRGKRGCRICKKEYGRLYRIAMKEKKMVHDEH